MESDLQGRIEYEYDKKMNQIALNLWQISGDI
jgi:hypothetical protein